MKKILKKLLSAVLASTLALSALPTLAAHDSDALKIGTCEILAKENIKPLDKSDWTICIYMCGSDLETMDSSATFDLLEILLADIPDNVTVLVLTGGAKEWNSNRYDKMMADLGYIEEASYIAPSSEFSQIYRIDDEKMNLVYTYDTNMDMSNVNTAAEFMEFALSYAPSEHLMFEMWNHGGGPMSGVAYDENTDKIMSIPDIAELARAIKENRGKNTDIFGFDACITSNLETANLLSPYADYMIASEEIEPGDGWDYEWLNIFNEAHKNNITANSIEIGKRIVDTFRECDNVYETRTLALIDLSEIPDVVEAFAAMSEEILSAYSDSVLYAEIARRMSEVKKFSYSEYGLIDLYDFASIMQPILSETSKLIEALGTPPKTDENNLTGEVMGESPAIIYRATCLELDNAIGLGFFYPTIKTKFGKTTDKVMEKLDKYNLVSVNDNYSEYVRKSVLEADKQQHFEGELITGYNPGTNKHYMKIDCVSAPESIKKVDSVYICSKTNTDGTKTDYRLGVYELAKDWDNLYFEGEFDEKWYSINNEIFSCTRDKQPEYTMYEIPVVIGENKFLSVMEILEFPDYPGMGYILSIADLTPESETASRSYKPYTGMTFRTVLLKYDPNVESLSSCEYICNDTILTPEELSNGYYSDYLIDFEHTGLESSKDVLYNVYFQVTDMKDDTYLSEPATYILSQQISDFTIAEIPPQIYTGGSVEPRVTVLYNGGEIVMDNSISVRYSDNIEKGTATATVVFDRENLKDELSTEFEIKDASEIFTDISRNDWFFDDAAYMHSLGLVYNINENEFNPDVTILRCEMAILLYHYDVTAYYNSENTLEFEDVEKDAYYINELVWAQNKGIIKGVSSTELAPYNEITRAEAVEMLRRFAEYKNYDTSVSEINNSFSDTDEVPEWAAEAIAWAVDRGLINGTDLNTIEPDKHITHAELAAIIHRFGMLKN